MIEPATLRDARPGDVAFIAESNLAMAWETEHKRLDPGVLRAGVESVFAEPQRGFYLVAERAAERVGCLLVTREWSDWRNGDWWWIQSVYVVESARRTGVFRAMYAEVERRARARDDVVGLRLYVEGDNHRAQATYRNRGMAETSYRLYEAEFLSSKCGC